MILSLILYFFGIYGLMYFYFYYMKNLMLYNYNYFEIQYLETIKKHNFCACQTLSSRICNTWKKIKFLENQMKEQKKKYNKYGNLLSKMTFRYIKFQKLVY